MRLGADPEVFVAIRARQHEGLISSRAKTGDPVPVCGLIGAGKHNPKPIQGLSTGFAVQEDNVALEYNIPPAATRSQFQDYIKLGLYQSLKEVKIPGIEKTGKQVSFSNLSAFVFDADALVHPSAQVFGCDPDFNAWTKEQNKKPALKGRYKNLRSCGGHIHVETDKDPYLVGRAMDLFLGVPFTLWEGPAGELRRKLYGKAGAIRVKKYGVEYRSLSNRWIFNDTLVGWVWDQTEKALAVVDSLPYEDLAGPVQQAINGYRPDVLESLMTAFDIKPVPNSVSSYQFLDGDF